MVSYMAQEIEGISREAKRFWASSRDHWMISFQHDGCVIGLRVGVSQRQACAELTRVCTMALSSIFGCHYLQPVEGKPMVTCADGSLPVPFAPSYQKAPADDALPVRALPRQPFSSAGCRRGRNASPEDRHVRRSLRARSFASHDVGHRIDHALTLMPITPRTGHVAEHPHRAACCRRV